MSGGMFNQGSFVGAGIPYLSGSTIAPGQQQAFFFPTVAKRVKVQINDVSGGVGAIRVHMAGSSPNNNVQANNHYWTVFQTAALRNEMDTYAKCTAIFVTGQTSAGGAISYQVLAELTPISSNDFGPALSGTGIDK